MHASWGEIPVARRWGCPPLQAKWQSSCPQCIAGPGPSRCTEPNCASCCTHEHNSKRVSLVSRKMPMGQLVCRSQLQRYCCQNFRPSSQQRRYFAFDCARSAVSCCTWLCRLSASKDKPWGPCALPAKLPRWFLVRWAPFGPHFCCFPCLWR
jgi:hypothetical protein